MLPYGKQTIDQADIDAVVAAISDRMLTSGPQVEEFENQFATATQSKHAVAVSSGTAALHAALSAMGISENDEVIVPAITFVATANAVLYCGGRAVFADVDPGTLLIDVNDVAKKITKKTKAIIAMDYAGQPCNYANLRNLANHHGLRLIADACHSLGGTYQDRPVGSLADMTCFSFHPVKQITTCEGGMVTTNDADAARQMRQFRSHGIDATAAMRQATNTHQYDMKTLGFNYRLSDVQCALGISQLKKLDSFVSRRQQIAERYQQKLADVKFVQLLTQHSDRSNGCHLMVMKWDNNASGCERDELYHHLKQNDIGVNVHYRPVYQNTYYEDRFGM
ncbi:UDP-4-amino-4,6-dideoxy-N-acetyl-beta-L-altrosamine transaminase, partial [bacterium]|nr:UDP-4-amino-4,6-dideoxy-N-acetyl-beta-L-altrosamine transaminase [bacterium]